MGLIAGDAERAAQLDHGLKEFTLIESSLAPTREKKPGKKRAKAERRVQ